jgi:hypothetical protein
VTLGSEGTGRLNLVTSNARVTLAGTLRVQLAPGFVPAVGQTFDLITAANRTGEFQTLMLPELGPGKRWAISYDANKVTLSVDP